MADDVGPCGSCKDLGFYAKKDGRPLKDFEQGDIRFIFNRIALFAT